MFQKSGRRICASTQHLEVPLLVCVLVTQLCLTLCKPMDCSLQGSSVRGIIQARILVWVVIFLSRGSSWPRDWTRVSCTAGRFFTIWTIPFPLWESPNIKRQSNNPFCISETGFLMWQLEKSLSFPVGTMWSVRGTYEVLLPWNSQGVWKCFGKE